MRFLLSHPPDAVAAVQAALQAGEPAGSPRCLPWETNQRGGENWPQALRQEDVPGAGRRDPLFAAPYWPLRSSLGAWAPTSRSPAPVDGAGAVVAACSPQSGACTQQVARAASSASRFSVSPRGWRVTLPGAGVPDAVLDPVAGGHLVNRLDLASLKAGNNLLQPPPATVHIQQGLGLVEDPVVFDRFGTWF